MLWVLFALLTAFFESMKDVASKRSLGGFRGVSSIDEYVVAWSLRAFALPFLLPLLLFVGIPGLGTEFLLALLVGGGLNVVATILYMKAIKASDLSITVPMVTFTPLFLLITSPLIVNEFPSAFGIIGILLIVIGSYILNIKNKGDGLMSPIKSLLREKGPRLMLCVAFIYSISSNFDKVGVLNSSPIFWIISVNVFVMLFMLPILYMKSGREVKQIPANIKSLLPIGLFSALLLTFQMTAITMTLVAYLISIKRTSAIMSVMFGALFFKEKNLRGRLAGAVIMVLGVLLITLF
jgi:drug/metabolite transporter (DMT)-like permease